MFSVCVEILVLKFFFADFCHQMHFFFCFFWVWLNPIGNKNSVHWLLSLKLMNIDFLLFVVISHNSMRKSFSHLLNQNPEFFFFSFPFTTFMIFFFEKFQRSEKKTKIKEKNKRYFCWLENGNCERVEKKLWVKRKKNSWI